MAPIRTAIVGLSSSATTGWASRGHLPYLLSPEGKEKFQIVALCNSSVEAAQRAIHAYDLPAETVRAYGNPVDLAADPDVQLVVIATRVDNHYDGALPSLRAGKDVLVEWPLAENAARASELAALAGENGVKTVVGLQGWFASSVVKVGEIIASGRIGKVLSSEVRAAGGVKGRDVVPPGLKYFTERKVGGNPFTIGFGHMFDFIQHLLGDIQNPQSRLQIQRPEVKITNTAPGEIDPTTGFVNEVVISDVPDLIIVTGSLPTSDYVVKGATLNIRFRKGQPFNGEPPMVWYINGEKGEIRLIAHSGPSMQVGGPVDIDVEVFASGEVSRVHFDETYSELPLPARNMASLYEAYAKGALGEYPDFEHAVKRHSQLDEMLAEFEA